MDQREELSRLRDDEAREELSIRQEERRLAREARAMEQELEDFETAEERVEKLIEEEWRREFGGHDPDYPPLWPRHERPHPRDDTRRRDS